MSDQLPTSTTSGTAPPADSRSSSWPLTVLAWLAAFAAMWLLLYPLNFQDVKVTAFLSEQRMPRINTLSNVLLFVPLGGLLGWLMWRRGHWLAGVVVAVGVSVILSLLGEWLQMWLPDRQSSLTDVIANVVGCTLGAFAVRVVVRWLDARYSTLTSWLAPRPAMRWAGLAMVVILAAKAAPFDVSVETFYIRQTYYQTRDAGLPFNQTWHAMRSVDRGAALNGATTRELWAAAVNAALMAAATIAIALAIRESLLRGHDRTNPAPYALILGCIFAVAAEASQGLVRSRVMDATDLVAGLVGVFVAALAVGITMAAVTWRARRW